MSFLDNKENHRESSVNICEDLVHAEEDIKKLSFKQLRSLCKRNEIHLIAKKETLQKMLMEKLYDEQMKKYTHSAEQYAHALEEFSKVNSNEFPFVIKKFTPVATWSYNVENGTCPICRQDFTELCVGCIVKEEKLKASGCKDKRIQCKIETSRGCNHIFHECCIASWVKKSSKCPLCQVTWRKGYYFENTD
uniref:RING-type domain-containing protein n=1 Tax=Parastrongyloides trichosuri TaxID=131310 RepID=A0A0N4ZQ13_PARTI